MTDLPFGPPTTAPNAGAAPRRRCLHPRQYRRPLEEGGTVCMRCGKDIEASASRRARNNRTRGLALQRKVLAAMGLEHIPGNAPNKDGRSRGENGLHVAEVKSGARFNEADYRNIVDIPATAGQARWLVKVETPGPGHRARVTVTTTLEDWQGLFAGVSEEIVA